MNHLVNYVNAILNAPSPRRARLDGSSRNRWTDQGYTVVAEQSTYVFDDGAMIQRTTEQDDYPAEAACAECWIRYEVVRQPPGDAIQPGHICFNNACREAFWRRYFSPEPPAAPACRPCPPPKPLA
ncbi:hypothetical protein HA052_10925 [Chromobacterium haemolyticum]|uniref:Uncharacterized protein n=1 Tax=Chromobacterium fluminis TaxID=3044269 RepID=A0ABX0L803_9NEIS|nr:hypothetical protein [Chromobacterium haemolyticum]NHR05712.1 hypothetical protein [Chromobacterium haemolyticum]